ncbi:hypothetical protein FACS189465_1050 [Clostridia bacterium]|nr:hypothetical protein FACS189465_1050 [Clostridia bacterium]
MTNLQKSNIAALRKKGDSYAKIAVTLSISENTVKSYCRRNKLGTKPIINEFLTANNICNNCKQQLCSARRNKKFCSDKCRLTWWKNNSNKLKRVALYQAKCANCGKNFESYGNKNRKFCSHKCFISHRFKSL